MMFEGGTPFPTWTARETLFLLCALWMATIPRAPLIGANFGGPAVLLLCDKDDLTVDWWTDASWPTMPLPDTASAGLEGVSHVLSILPLIGRPPAHRPTPRRAKIPI